MQFYAIVHAVTLNIVYYVTIYHITKSVKKHSTLTELSLYYK